MRMGQMKNVYKLLVGKRYGMRQLLKPRHRLEDNIRMDLRVIICEVVVWMHLAEDRYQ